MAGRGRPLSGREYSLDAMGLTRSNGHGGRLRRPGGDLAILRLG